MFRGAERLRLVTALLMLAVLAMLIVWARRRHVALAGR